jgi:hypothetical protein
MLKLSALQWAKRQAKATRRPAYTCASCCSKEILATPPRPCKQVMPKSIFYQHEIIHCDRCYNILNVTVDFLYSETRKAAIVNMTVMVMSAFSKENAV